MIDADQPMQGGISPAVVARWPAASIGNLMHCFGPNHPRVIEASLPRTAQATWDEVARRQPALAAEIVASV